MVNEYMFYEIMQMPSEKNCSLVIALDKMSQYTKDIKLLTNEKNEIFYRVDAKKLMNMDIDSMDLLKLNQSGWVLNENKEFLEYFFN